MFCPYPDCDGEVVESHAYAHCLKCERPVLKCPKCGTSNRSFARHCRTCNQLIYFPETRRLLPRADAELSGPEKQVVVNLPFWLSPVAYRGFLWCLSATGEVIEISPFKAKPHHFGTLGGGFGRSAFTITPQAGDDVGNLAPYLFAASPQALSGINLLTGEAAEFLPASAGEHLLSNFEEGYAGVESRGRTVFFLKRREGRLYLAALDLSAMTVEHYPVAGDEIVGPLRAGDRVGIYSRNALYLLDAKGLREAARFPAAFSAWVTPGENSSLQPRVGRMPFIARPDSIYIPGTSRGVAGFLYVSLRGEAGGASFLPLAGESCCSQDASGHLLVARAGGIDMYEGITPQAVCRDTQVNAQSPAYHDDSLTAYFVRTAGSVESIRFYYNNRAHDYSLAHLGSPIGMEFITVAGALALPYLSEGAGGSRLGIMIWDAR